MAAEPKKHTLRRSIAAAIGLLVASCASIALYDAAEHSVSSHGEGVMRMARPDGKVLLRVAAPILY